ncbi:MAG: hypothetical protein ACTSUV_01720 [Candidatus Ranarchaeia archaeon]
MSDDEELKLHDLYVIRREGGQCLLHQRFGSLKRDSSLVSSFFQAIDNFADEVLADEGTLDKIERGDVKFLFERGKHSVLALVTNQENSRIRKKMKKLITKFEAKYSEDLTNWDSRISQFQDFRGEVLTEFPFLAIDPNWIPKLKQGEREVDYLDIGKTSEGIKEDLARVIRNVDGVSTVRQISNALEIPLKKTVAYFSVWLKYGWVYFIPALTADAIPQLMKENIEEIKDSFGEKGIEVVKRCDGKLSIGEIAEKANVPVSVLKTIFQRFIYSGVLMLVGFKESEAEEEEFEEPFKKQTYQIMFLPKCVGKVNDISENESRILELCNGERTITEIAKILNKKYHTIYRIISLNNKEYLKITRVIGKNEVT